MRAVDVGVGHDDDAMVARLVGVEVVADVRADGRDQRADGVAGQRAVQARALHVEDLAAQGQDGLRLAVAGLLGRAACGIALYDEQFGVLRGLGRAVGQLARQRERVQHALAARHLARLACGFAGLERLGGLADDALGRGRVLLEVLGQALGHGVLHQRADLGVAQLRLRLSLELRVVQLHGHDGRAALARVVAGEVGILLLEDALRAGVLVDGARDGLLEAVEVRAAFVRVDVVRERHDGVRGVRGGPLHGHFNGAVVVLGLEVDGLVQRFLALVQEFHEVDDAAGVLEHLGARVAVGVGDALVVQHDLEALVEERHLAEAVRQSVEIVHGGLGEDLRVGPERHGRAVAALRGANFAQLLGRLAVVEADEVLLALLAHLHFHAGRQRVHDGDAHAVQAAGHLVALAAELAACVQDGEHHLDGGDLLFRVLVDRDTAPVVVDRDRVVLMDPHLDLVAVSGERFVDGVVDDLVHQVVQAARARRADVHARTLADRLQALEDLNVRTVVMVRFVCH